MKHNGITLLACLLALLQSSLLFATVNPLIKSVPADTVFFSGNTQLINIADYPLMPFSQSMEPPLSQNQRQELGNELNFLYELFQDFEQVIQQGHQAMQTHYGLPDEIAAIAYTVGVTPVLKLTLGNGQAFLNVLDNAEDKSGFKHVTRTFEGLTYRAYPLTDKHEFIVVIQDSDEGQKQATIALFSNILSEQTRKLIFGLSKPASSLADTGKLEAIEKDNHYLPVSISFVDFQQLVKSLFQEKQNPWIELFGDNEQIIANLQASQCEADIMAIASDMPRMIGGYKNYQVRGQRITMDLELLLELKNQNVKTELSQFRGFIPGYIRNGARDHIAAFGLGANMSQLSPMFFYVTKAFRESTFKCTELIELQQEVAKLNPAMLALVTGVVDGVQGISFALQQFKLSAQDSGGNTGDVSSHTDLSMILSLAADNPLKVWQMLSAFAPELALITPSEKPQKLNLPALNAMGLELSVVSKGQHLALYSGEQAALISRNLMNEKMVTNGFFQESLNYTRLALAAEDLRQYMASPASPETLPAEACNYFDESIEILSRVSGFIDIQSDFISTGWVNAMTADIELLTRPQSNFQLTGKYETLYVQDGCQLARDGLEELLDDGSGFYQQYSDDGQCFIFETRYRWAQDNDQINLKYVSERSRPDGICTNAFSEWAIPDAEYINDVCQLRSSKDGAFACVYQWDDVLTKSVYKRI